MAHERYLVVPVLCFQIVGPASRTLPGGIPTPRLPIGSMPKTLGCEDICWVPGSQFPASFIISWARPCPLQNNVHSSTGHLVALSSVLYLILRVTDERLHIIHYLNCIRLHYATLHQSIPCDIIACAIVSSCGIPAMLYDICSCIIHMLYQNNLYDIP